MTRCSSTVVKCSPAPFADRPKQPSDPGELLMFTSYLLADFHNYIVLFCLCNGTGDGLGDAPVVELSGALNHMYLHVNKKIYIYIYLERERERERNVWIKSTF